MFRRHCFFKIVKGVPRTFSNEWLFCMVFILFQINHIIYSNGPDRYLYDKLGRYNYSESVLSLLDLD